MITIDLQAHFNSQARVDHLHRMKVLLTALDFERGFSEKPDFIQSISNAVDLLDVQGVTHAYSQACALLSLFAGKVSIQNTSCEKDPQAWVLRCMQQALSAGVPAGAFHSLFESLSGLGRFDQPWPCAQVQINLMDLLAAVHMNNQPARIQCDRTGSVGSDVSIVADELVNLFRTDSGFVHQVFGQFTPDLLIAQVCKDVLPESPLTINVDPVFERCEIGRQNAYGFCSLQRIELIDARIARVDFKQQKLSCSDDEKQRLESAWLESDLLSDFSLHIAKPWLSADLQCCGQWVTDQGVLGFFMRADMQLRAAADGLKWRASLTHNDVPVSLDIQAQRDIHIQWQHSEQKLPGQLPVGEPLWLAEYRVPLYVHVSSVIGVGKPVIRTTNHFAGELVFGLSVLVNPANRQLEVVLTVDHSELVCNWQSVDPLHGWASGCWRLAVPARIMERGLQNG